MTVLGLTVVGPRVAAAVLLSTALYTLVPGYVTHAEWPTSTPRYAADGVYRARHPFQSTDRTGKYLFRSLAFGGDDEKRGGGRRAREGREPVRGHAFVVSVVRVSAGGSLNWFHHPFAPLIASFSRLFPFAITLFICSRLRFLTLGAERRGVKGQNRLELSRV